MEKQPVGIQVEKYNTEIFWFYPKILTLTVQLILAAFLQIFNELSSLIVFGCRVDF